MDPELDNPMTHIARLVQRASVAAGLVCLAAGSAPAVIVSTLHDGATARAPGGNTGWHNVAIRGTASAVYLGNRWAITANHVGDGSLEFSDGSKIDFVPGSGLRLNNDSGQAAGSPDLRMFRLVEDPGLASLEIDTESPPPGTDVMMIGAGRDRTLPLLGWSTSRFPWASVLLPFADRLGYNTASSRTMRWGTNDVTGPVTISGTTAGFQMTFNRPADAFEAQATTGDSGGGVFRLVDDTWMLVGIMTSVTTLSGQPSGTVIFGQSTQAADLTAYRDQITDLVTAPDPPWQNQLNYYDVDRSGMVTPRDQLLIFNELILNGAHELEGLPLVDSPLYDVSGDGLVSSRDAQLLINAFLTGTANPAAAVAPGTMLIPEPSTGALVLVGLLSVALAHGARSIRRRGVR